MPKRLPRTLIAWVRSAAMVGVPTLLLAWLRDAADLHITTFVLIVPLVAAGWQGGVGDAIVASVTLFLLTHYLNVPPYYEIKPSLADIPRFALVLAIGLLGAFRGLAETRQQARAAQQAALARIARHAVESRQLQDTLVLAAATMAETLDVPFALIVEKLGPRGRVLAANHPITLTTDPFPWTDGQTQDHGRLVLVRTADASVPPDVVTLLKGLGGRPSALTAPFSVHGSVAGLLVAGTPDRRAFTPGDAEWLLSVGFVLAAAIERARLDEQRSMLLAATQEARRDAEHANRLKDEFLATLSHELRTPLNVLMGWVSMLRESELDKEGRDRALTALERNAQAQFRLVQDLLDTSQIVSGRLRLQPQLLDIVPIVRQAVDTVLPTAQSKDITIDVDLPAGDLTVRGDAVRLQQVFWNLLVNALKFTPIGG
ncbi:MAG: histidine kinase dimerization/phospho-acceptor domain-containing protein, partial [Vicinamibacterales bacterium]